MKYLSLFTGIGGFELGIQQAYESNTEHASLGKESEQKECAQGGFGSPDKLGTLLHDRDGAAPLCVGYSEIDKYAVQIYQHHFPEHRNYGDITKIEAETLPDFDLLCGGFPCQAFSIAGKRRGFEDTRGTLFFDIARIIRSKRPRLLLLENVKGLLSHDEGRTFRTIIAALDELGYDLQWQVLNSKDFGVPQNRERVFIVGHLRGTPRPQVFPFGENDGEDTGVPRHVSNTLTARYEGAQATGTYVGEGKQHAQRQPLRFLDRNQKNIEGDYAFTVDSSQTSGVRVEGLIRRLTPIECERLQGFPDGWTSSVSDTQRYKTLGNAITTNVVQAIISKML